MGIIHVASPTGAQSQYEETELRTMWEEGLLEEGTQYWKEGMSEWRPVADCFSTEIFADASSHMESTPAYSYSKDPRSLTALLIVMLWICLGSEVANLLGDFAEMALLSGPFTEAQAEANDVRQGLLGLSYIIVFVVTAIAFLKWVYRANLNSRGFGAEDMRFSPGWSVGYYFIPFLNFVRPYQSMKEIWQVSLNPIDWKSVEGSPLLGWWWGLWLVSGLLGRIVLRTSRDAETIEALQFSTALSILSGFIGIVLCLVTLRLIKKISKMQEQLVESG